MESHVHEHEVLFLTCKSCGSDAMRVTLMQGAILFDCIDCDAECGMMEDIATETKLLLERGCQDH